MQRLQQQREQQQTLQQQQSRRRQLDHGLRLKMKRLSREQQDELQLDMNILQTLLQQETDERQDAAHRKVNTPGGYTPHLEQLQLVLKDLFIKCHHKKYSGPLLK